MNNDIKYMRIALNEAKKAYLKNEVPVGCCIVKDGIVLAKGYNMREEKSDVTMHAEIVAIKKACKKLNRWILDDCTIYITAEPCLMCSGAISQARINHIVYGVASPKYGCCESIANVFDNPKINHNDILITKGILSEEIEKMMKSFFQSLRK